MINKIYYALIDVQSLSSEHEDGENLGNNEGLGGL
jgi:hypothetical protein